MSFPFLRTKKLEEGLHSLGMCQICINNSPICGTKTGIHEECDELPEGVEDVDERSTSTTEAAAEDTLGVQPTPTVHCGLSAKWTTSSRINVQNLASFNTPGAGCVTTLVPMPKGTILVLTSLFYSLFCCQWPVVEGVTVIKVQKSSYSVCWCLPMIPLYLSSKMAMLVTSSTCYWQK